MVDQVETPEFQLPETFEVRVERTTGRARNQIALNVHRLRKKRGWSQRELAEQSGTQQPNISDVETGDANPTIATLGKLAAALEVTVGDLLAPTRAPRFSTRKIADRVTGETSGAESWEGFIDEPVMVMHGKPLKIRKLRGSGETWRGKVQKNDEALSA